MRFVPLSILLCGALLSSASVAQQSSLEPVVEAAEQINSAARSSQLTIDTIAETTQERLQQYKQIMRQIDGLEVYTEQLSRQIQNQEAEADALNASIDEVSVVERQITPLMLRMIDSLAKFIELDVPFLPEERQQRVSQLRDLLERANVDVSEKFRRVMEAYQIEAEYGRNIEAYNGEMLIDNAMQQVEFLRVGRSVFLYKTRDDSHLAIWNQQQGKWQELGSEHLIHVKEAMRIARKQLAPDLLMLPVFAAGE